VAAKLASFYSAAEESARLLDIPCSGEVVWPILTAYQDVVATSAITFRLVLTDTGHDGDLDCRFTMIPAGIDPYAIATSHGLIPETGHPADALFSDIQERCPIDCHGIDFGVVGGFKKTWQFFPPGQPQELPVLAGIPSMPSALAENVSVFARYAMSSKTTVTGIDYSHNTMNVYFGELSPDCLEPKVIASMLHDIGMPDPSEQLLRVGQQTFNINVTLSWHSSKVERICFYAMTQDPAAFGIQFEPVIEKYARNAPCTFPVTDRKLICGVSIADSGEYYKLAVPYQWPSGIQTLLR
jgi:6-linalyl-2-O,3-dimethylflaviolin/7-geranyloxy-5-hydroxy-2-methoxy-3-methylnaphthalene-1,4-dione synthase